MLIESMHSLVPAFILIGIVALLVLTVILINREVRKRVEAEENVTHNSKRFLFLIQLEKALHDEGLAEMQKVYDYTTSLNSKTQFDRLERMSAVKKAFLEYKYSITDQLKKTARNKELRAFYTKALEKAPFLESSNPDKRYTKAEEKLTAEYEEKLEPVVPVFRFNFYYTSPQGRNHYEQTWTLDFPEMIDLYKQIQSDEKHKTSAQYERSQMTQTLRYDVMKRDHFRCVLCGRSADDGVKMHVDHIVPVAKGGKTVMSNLRTLCEDCNRGKRDKYDENGEN